MKRNTHKQRKMRRGTDLRQKISVIARDILGAGWKDKLSIQRQGENFIWRLRKVIDKAFVARLHEAMQSLAARYGRDYDSRRRSLSVAA